MENCTCEYSKRSDLCSPAGAQAVDQLFLVLLPTELTYSYDKITSNRKRNIFVIFKMLYITQLTNKSQSYQGYRFARTFSIGQRFTGWEGSQHSRKKLQGFPTAHFSHLNGFNKKRGQFCKRGSGQSMSLWEAKIAIRQMLDKLKGMETQYVGTFFKSKKRIHRWDSNSAQESSIYILD